MNHRQLKILRDAIEQGVDDWRESNYEVTPERAAELNALWSRAVITISELEKELREYPELADDFPEDNPDGWWSCEAIVTYTNGHTFTTDDIQIHTVPHNGDENKLEQVVRATVLWTHDEEDIKAVALGAYHWVNTPEEDEDE